MSPAPAGNRRLGAILLRVDPARLLFPLIQSWPAPSASVETLLFRREGDDIVYLNDLRDKSGPARNFRFTIHEEKLLAAIVARGKQGVLEGTDYREVPVIGAGRAIPGSPWYLVTKMDAAELYAPVYQQGRLAIGVILGFVLLGGMATWMWWRQKHARLLVSHYQVEAERHALVKHFDYLSRYANDIIVLFDDAGRIVEVNDRAISAYGYRRDVLLGMNVTELRTPEARHAWERDFRLWGKDGIVYETVHKRSDGSSFAVEVSGRIIESDGRRFHQGIIRDITDRKRAEDGMRLYAKVFESSLEAVVITDADQKVLMVNDAFVAITGYTREEIVGNTPRMLASGRQDPAFYREMWDSIGQTGHWQGEILNRRKNGQVYPEWETISAVTNGDGTVTHYVATFSDVSEHKAAQDRISYLAYHDSLTGLPNRLLMQDRLEQATAAARREDDKVGVMLMDLDRFKMVNDSLGHAGGDALLKAVAERIKACLRESDTLSRLGGDEFVVILPSVKESEAVGYAAERVLLSFAAPFRVEGHDIRVTTSIGISVFPLDGADIDSLVKNADTAMYHAKENGRNNYQFFTGEMNARVSERLAIEGKLNFALEREEFALVYQPQVDMRDNRTVGFEALIRWEHPELGTVSPARFIPIAEESGLITSIGEWVLREACAQAVRWHRLGDAPVPVSVNVSAVQLHGRDFLGMLKRILQDTGVDPSRLELELTESVVMRHGEETVGLLDGLKGLGVQLAIDDFGTGYSSLAYLKRFPLDRLKIDRSFVADIGTDNDSAEIVRAVIALGHSMKLLVIAEGVENEQQVAFLRANGCDQCQGYYFSRPLVTEQVTRWLGKAC